MVRIVVLLMLALATPGHARSPLAGDWALVDGGAVLLRLRVGDGDAPAVDLVRPAELSLSGGEIVATDATPIRYAATSGALEGDALRLRFVRAGQPAMTVLLRPLPDGRVSFDLPDILPEPLLLVRRPFATTLPGIERGRRYSAPLPRPTNDEMSAIFAADQADRAPDAAIDWASVGPRDAERLARTQALLDAGALRSGDDFFHAAFVFQHGPGPAAHLKAHLLAMVAVARGRAEATWIAAASLDRYLQGIGQPQVLGTQFSTPDDGPTTQEPYDRTFASDALRQTLGVATLAVQEEQRQMLDRESPRP